MKISEIFYTIQGEGYYSGVPTVFIRLTGCNLRCAWCDTSYAFSEGEELTVDEILNKVHSFGCKRVTISGGEPFFQDLGELLIWLKKEEYFIEVETNGTFTPPYENLIDHLVISPKLPSSGFSPQFHKIFSLIESYNSTLKIVVANQEDYDYLIKHKHCFNDAPLYIQLESKEEINKESAQLLVKRFLEDFKDNQRFDEYPVRISIQLQKVIWGTKRGV